MGVRSIAAALAVVVSGCDIGGGGRCTVESRAVQYEAETRRGALIGTAFLELSETRGAEDRDWVIWHLRAAPLAGRVTRVSLRQGTPGSPGRVLYEFPVVNPVPESGVITQVFVRTPYAGAVPFAELWELVQREPVTFEAVFDSNAEPLRVGPLVLTDSTDWQDACS